MNTRLLAAAATLAAPLLLTPVAHAQMSPGPGAADKPAADKPAAAKPPAAKHQPGDPIPVGQDLMFDPIVDGRLRYEHVDTATLDADAVTMRLRAGFELKHASGFAFLAEGEGTLGIDNDYNALPFALGSRQRRPGFATVGDPQNVEINRLQLQYKTKALTATLGRQRINLDDRRWVGDATWRQNEQTFDAVRIETKFGPVSFDGTYASSQRTIFGIDGLNRQSYDGDFGFLNAGLTLGPVQVKGFAYLLDYDRREQVPAIVVAIADTQTYGLRAVAAFPLAPGLKLNAVASYARQSDWKGNPVDYHADYVNGEAGLSYGLLTGTVGYEKLGSDNGRAVQTPLALLHKFNGWADIFLVTPNAGLQDRYVGAAYKFNGVKALPGLNAAVSYHRFDSDVGDVRYGNEIDASVGFKVGPYAVLIKYADYDARRFATDTEKFWAEIDFTF